MQEFGNSNKMTSSAILFATINALDTHLREVRCVGLRGRPLLLEDVDLVLLVASTGSSPAPHAAAVGLVALVLVGEVVVLRPARLGLAARAEAATANVHQGRRRRNLDLKLMV